MSVFQTFNFKLTIASNWREGNMQTCIKRESIINNLKAKLIMMPVNRWQAQLISTKIHNYLQGTQNKNIRHGKENTAFFKSEQCSSCKWLQRA